MFGTCYRDILIANCQAALSSEVRQNMINVGMPRTEHQQRLPSAQRRRERSALRRVCLVLRTHFTIRIATLPLLVLTVWVYGNVVTAAKRKRHCDYFVIALEIVFPLAQIAVIFAYVISLYSFWKEDQPDTEFTYGPLASKPAFDEEAKGSISPLVFDAGNSTAETVNMATFSEQEDPASQSKRTSLRVQGKEGRALSPPPVAPVEKKA